MHEFGASVQMLPWRFFNIYSQRTHIKMKQFLNGGLSDCYSMPMPVLMVICSWNVENSLLSRFSYFIRSHLQEYSYHPVSLSLLCPLSLSRLLSLPSSFFFFLHSFFIALSIPSILLLARLHLFFLTSLSFLPVFQPWLFPPSFTVTLTLSRPISLTFRALLSFPSSPSFCFCYALSTSTSLSLFLSQLLFLEYVIFHTSWHPPSLTDPVSTLFPISLSFPSVPPVFR